MNMVLWIIQVVLGLLFLMAGFTKAFNYAKVKNLCKWSRITLRTEKSNIGTN